MCPGVAYDRDLGTHRNVEEEDWSAFSWETKLQDKTSVTHASNDLYVLIPRDIVLILELAIVHEVVYKIIKINTLLTTIK